MNNRSWGALLTSVHRKMPQAGGKCPAVQANSVHGVCLRRAWYPSTGPAVFGLVLMVCGSGTRLRGSSAGFDRVVGRFLGSWPRGSLGRVRHGGPCRDVRREAGKVKNWHSERNFWESRALASEFSLLGHLTNLRRILGSSAGFNLVLDNFQGPSLPVTVGYGEAK